MGNVLQPFTPDEALNGKELQTITSLEVAEMVEKNHKDLMRDIRRFATQLAGSKIAPGDFFTESTYLDANNQNRPCFLVTRKGCEFIANKLTGAKGTVFTARFINRFHEMEGHIKSESETPEISFKEQVQSLEAVADMLHMNDASKLLMLENFYKQYNIPTQFLPKYEHNGSREMKAPKYLLEENGCGISSQKFNVLLMEHGFLEERERPASKGGTKKFKALTERGLEYGENAVSPHNQKEVQPLYYADTFMELYDLVI